MPIDFGAAPLRAYDADALPGPALPACTAPTDGVNVPAAAALLMVLKCRARIGLSTKMASTAAMILKPIAIANFHRAEAEALLDLMNDLPILLQTENRVVKVRRFCRPQFGRGLWR